MSVFLGIHGHAELLPSAQGWYLFQGYSPSSKNNEWKMSGWHDSPAGKHGRITSMDHLLIYNRKPFKLWGINVTFDNCAPDQSLADKRADFYAALGINAVRLHKYADGCGALGILSASSASVFDPLKLNKFDYFVSALKTRGIYTKLSPVFIVKVGPDDIQRVPYFKEFNPSEQGWANPKHGSLYFSTELQEVLFKQVTKLLSHKNPYTALTYANDPAIAYVELYNEDSALFYGTNNVLDSSPTLRTRAGKLFSDWLINKYHSREALVGAWGQKSINHSLLVNLPRNECIEEDRIYPYGNPWSFDPRQLDGKLKLCRQRLLDTMSFLYELQNDVYARYAKAIRATGYTGELVASNWQAGRAMSHFYNLHSDAMIGTIDRHNYFGGFHSNKISFNHASMLSVPGGGLLSASLQQVYNRPFMLSEWIHVYPNEWGVEGPAIIGAYGMGLQGWDASFAFQNRDTGTFASALGLQDWDAVAPQFLGIFPAVSRQVLRGDIKESKDVHFRNVNISALSKGRVGFIEDIEQQWDIKSFSSDVFPSFALASAKGVVRFSEEYIPTDIFDSSAYQINGAVVSSTNELRWIAGKHPLDGHVIINTNATQAVIGFSQGVVVNLADSIILPASRYGAIYITAISPQGTLATDKAVLISAISRARNEGSIIANDNYFCGDGTIDKLKMSGPILMEQVIADITLKRSEMAIIYVLDQNGVKTGETLENKHGLFTIDTGRDRTPYYLVNYGQH